MEFGNIPYGVMIKAMLRNGHQVRYRRLNREELCGEFVFMGYHPEQQMFWSNGDPELWKENGTWRYDGKPSAFDIVSNLGIEVMPGVLVPIPNQS